MQSATTWCSSGDSNSGFLLRFAQKAFLYNTYRLAAEAATADIVIVSGVRHHVNRSKKDGLQTVFFWCSSGDSNSGHPA